MAEVTVKQLADTVGAPVDRLLTQMQEAGLPHSSAESIVSEEEKQTLLAFLKRSHGGSDENQPKKITLKRKTLGTLKTGQGKTGRTVNVEVRRKRTYVKKEAEVAEKESIPEPEPNQAELEAQKIREEEIARKTAEEELRKKENERKAEGEKRLAEEKKKQEELENPAQDVEKKSKKDKPKNLEVEAAKAASAAAEAQAKAQASERAGKRGKGKDRDRAKTGDFAGDGRQELSLKTRRRSKRKQQPAAVKLEQQGGEFRPSEEFVAKEIEVPDLISVGDLSQRMSVKAGEVIKSLMNMGVMATINQVLDQDTATLVVEEMGHKAVPIHEDAIEQAHEATLQIEGDASSRSPVVTVMGHVDHGKTSLLDYMRKSRIASGEAGGITQHIGAYNVLTPQGEISFIDTPGHAAFTAMRARGARVTDIVILVVAADDGVMPQTEEAIQHSKAANVPMVVAINKIDVEGADPEKVMNELAAKEVVPEEWGGDTQFIKVSAHTGEGVEALLEAILLQAEILELSAVSDAPARGVVIESRLDRGRGPVATMLVQNGTLKQGDVIIAGEYHGRVRAMLDDHGTSINIAGPSTPVEVLGVGGTPAAGDDFSVVTDERTARELAEFRRDKTQEQRVATQQAAKLDNMFANLGAGEKRILSMVLKTDVRGSLEAISQALVDMGNDEVAANILGSGVGGITESDANMALTYGATLFGFNVRADNAAKALIEKEGLEIRYYSIIYELLDDIKSALSGMLSPELREEIVGTAEVRDIFNSPRYGQIAGCMVIEGAVSRNKPIRVLRDNVVIYEGELESLRRFKDDVNEVRNGTECGIGVRNYTDVRAGDLIEVFNTQEIAREL